jgi:hypothetical protein
MKRLQTVYLYDHSTVFELKQIISGLEYDAIPVAEQKLVWGLKELEDEEVVGMITAGWVGLLWVDVERVEVVDEGTE